MGHFNDPLYFLPPYKKVIIADTLYYSFEEADVGRNSSVC